MMTDWPKTTWEMVANPSHHFVKSATSHLRHLVGQPLQVLEIGIYEAGSAVWLLEEVLTHPEATYTGIEIRPRPAALARLRPFGAKANVLRGASFDLLPTLHPASYDVIHVDGDHKVTAAFSDFVLAWPLLKVGGWFACDDLFHDKTPVVKPAFDQFRRMCGPAAELVEDARQGWLRKVA